MPFCQRHGQEVRIGACLEANEDSTRFFERFCKFHAPQQGDATELAVEFALDRLRANVPSDRDHYRALVAAYSEISDQARDELELWLLDESSADGMSVLDVLLTELHTMHKLLRTTHAESMTWLSEVLEEERQSLAARVAYLLRHSDLA